MSFVDEFRKSSNDDPITKWDPYTCTGTYDVPAGYRHCNFRDCIDYRADNDSSVENRDYFDYKPNFAPVNLTRIALPVDVCTSRNFTIDPVSLQVLSAKSGLPVGITKNHEFNKHTFYNHTWRYMNTRGVNFASDIYSNDGKKMNEVNQHIKRHQNFSGEFQIDFLQAYHKMIRNGYVGDFGVNDDRQTLDDTESQISTVLKLCRQLFLDINWGGSVGKFDETDLMWYCKSTVKPDRTFYDDSGDFVSEPVSSEYLDRVIQMAIETTTGAESTESTTTATTTTAIAVLHYPFFSPSQAFFDPLGPK